MGAPTFAYSEVDDIVIYCQPISAKDANGRGESIMESTSLNVGLHIRHLGKTKVIYIFF